MKKEWLILLLCILVLGFVAAEGQGVGSQKETSGESQGVQLNVNTEVKNQGEQTNLQNQIHEKLREGNYTGENGQQIQIQNQSNNRVMLRVGNVSVGCSCELEQKQIENRTRLMARLSNGKNAEIKVMPDAASETAMSRLRLKVCSEENNCTIELKEVGSGEMVQLAYKLEAEREAKVIGLFRTRMLVRAEIGAENGEILRIKKPWWSFLASESER